MWGSLSFKKFLFKIHLFYPPHDSLGYICPGTMEILGPYSKGWFTNSTATFQERCRCSKICVLCSEDYPQLIISTISSVESTSNANRLQAEISEAEISNLDILNQKYLHGLMLQKGQVGKYVFHSLNFVNWLFLTARPKGGDASWSICLTNCCSSLCLDLSVSIIQNGFGFI